MLVGLDYFLAHRIYVPRLQRKVYATWNGGPVFARGEGVGQYDERFAARPGDLAAARKLLPEIDARVRRDGLPVAGDALPP